MVLHFLLSLCLFYCRRKFLKDKGWNGVEGGRNRNQFLQVWSDLTWSKYEIFADTHESLAATVNFLPVMEKRKSLKRGLKGMKFRKILITHFSAFQGRRCQIFSKCLLLALFWEWEFLQIFKCYGLQKSNVLCFAKTVEGKGLKSLFYSFPN